MNLMGLGIDTKSLKFKRIVLHEFGHALGFRHEHRKCESEIRWNPDSNPNPDRITIQELFDQKGWGKVEEKNFKFETTKTALILTYDKDSIMHYFLPARVLKKGKLSDCCMKRQNYLLSEGDKDGLREVYPKLNMPIAKMQHKISMAEKSLTLIESSQSDSWRSKWKPNSIKRNPASSEAPLPADSSPPEKTVDLPFGPTRDEAAAAFLRQRIKSYKHQIKLISAKK